MLPEFLVKAWFAGVGLSAITAPLGCFVVWRRLAFFGDTLAHSTLLGIAIGLLLQINPAWAVLFTVTIIAFAVVLLQGRQPLTNDTLLGILSHSGLALGLVTISLSGGFRVDLMGLLFGDILALSDADLWLVGVSIPAILGVMAWLWRPLLFATMHEEMAAAQNTPVLPLKLALMLLLALVVAIAMKIVGALLITAMLILPPATARSLSQTPEQMAFGAFIIGVIAVTAGLAMSMSVDTPAGASIICAAFGLFLLSRVHAAAAAVAKR